MRDFPPFHGIAPVQTAGPPGAERHVMYVPVFAGGSLSHFIESGRVIIVEKQDLSGFENGTGLKRSLCSIFPTMKFFHSPKSTFFTRGRRRPK
jgi:hypothetical protein